MSHMITVTGNIGKVSGLIKAGDSQVINLSVASNYGKDQTTWFQTSVWGETAEKLQQYLVVGKTVSFSGTLMADEQGNCPTYTAADGTEKAAFKIRMVGGIQLHGGGQKSEVVPAVEDTNDIPF